MTTLSTRQTRPNRRQRDHGPLFGLIGTVLLSGSLWSLFFLAISPTEQPGTDSEVGCLDDCLEPMDPAEKRIDAEPIRHDQEEG